jgi:hypothetical protein
MLGDAAFVVQVQADVKKVHWKFCAYWMYVYFCKNLTGYFTITLILYYEKNTSLLCRFNDSICDN